MFGPYDGLVTGVNAQSFRADGPSGDVIVRAGSIELQQMGFIDSYTEDGAGRAGNVTVVASSIEVRNGSAIQSFALNGSGDSGDVDVTADRLLVFSDDGPGFTQLDTFSFFSSGDAGNLTINASTFTWSR